ncbi:WD40-repeat-containing domain protein [Thelonectria olida]|uniref:WD40-repeat-containing domain protein n=1 Tax=Thelonectria olida TaxID=1576542 RepID=A0A9P8VUH5_9HYPO|nr:WD40-repeat-containing domain protein [Thelonectria olida]
MCIGQKFKGFSLTCDSNCDMAEFHIKDAHTGARKPVAEAEDGYGGGYVPPHRDVPRYVHVKSYNTKDQHFKGLFLAQELVGEKRPDPGLHNSVTQVAIGSKILSHGDAAIWAADFSSSGRYLAVAGKDQFIRLFKVILTEEDRKAQEEEDKGAGTTSENFAPVFRSKPIREFKGHTGDVLDLSWSKNDFLLSCSADKTVRLWHTSQPNCLRLFAHEKIVTSVAFHPIDDRFFLSGSLDTKLRLWSIPDMCVAHSASACDFITAVAFTPEGKVAICGSLNGTCIFFDTDGLAVKYQIRACSSQVKNERCNKITGIQTLLIPENTDTNSGVKVLITTNDSQIRVYDMDDRTLRVKLEGLKNQSSQIHARFNDDGKYVICGSESQKVYIWHLGSPNPGIKDQEPCESFSTHSEVVTNAIIAPTATRQLLSASRDPVYDLCNPPPIVLLSLEESTAGKTAKSNPSFDDVRTTTAQLEESPTYKERCRHFDGNIIVTTDTAGRVKVFRQDCASKGRY